jgi:RNA polymerase sigma-70 factor (ECF subfamily)
MPDEEDVVRALEQLYRDKYDRYLRLALAVVGTREAAADAVQDAFVRAIRARATLRDPVALEAWLWRTVLNVSISQRSAAGRNAHPDAAESRVVTNGHPDEWRELRAAVAALPERQRSVLFLRHYADLDYERIGEVLGIARGTVAATLNQAHTALRKTIEVAR